jgi:hypothetical protein
VALAALCNATPILNAWPAGALSGSLSLFLGSTGPFLAFFTGRCLSPPLTLPPNWTKPADFFAAPVSISLPVPVPSPPSRRPVSPCPVLSGCIPPFFLLSFLPQAPLVALSLTLFAFLPFSIPPCPVLPITHNILGPTDREPVQTHLVVPLGIPPNRPSFFPLSPFEFLCQYPHQQKDTRG